MPETNRDNEDNTAEMLLQTSGLQELVCTLIKLDTAANTLVRTLH